jgi:hypothetical protein
MARVSTTPHAASQPPRQGPRRLAEQQPAAADRTKAAQCPDCGRRFATEAGRDEHRAAKHRPRTAYDELKPIKDGLEARDAALDVLEAKIRRTKGVLERATAKYPSGQAPGEVVDNFNGLLSEHNAEIDESRRLTVVYNRIVKRFNQQLRDDCSPA